MEKYWGHWWKNIRAFSEMRRAVPSVWSFCDAPYSDDCSAPARVLGFVLLKYSRGESSRFTGRIPARGAESSEGTEMPAKNIGRVILCLIGQCNFEEK